MFFSFISDDTYHHELTHNRVRHDLRDLSERDVMSLKAAMMDLQRDHGKTGWQVSVGVQLWRSVLVV